jgi:hypothetical protein
MLVEIDISLFTPTSAVGRIYGEIEFSILPRVGEVIDLSRATSAEASFNGQLVVQHVIHSVGATSTPTLSLSDLVACNSSEARSLAARLESAYGLFFEPYDQT